MLKQKQFKILLIENCVFQRLAITDMLSQCGYFVVEMENGKSALVELKDKTKKFDLILLDLNMSCLKDSEFVDFDTIMNDQNLRHIPVVGMGFDSMTEKFCKGIGVNFMYKPLRMVDCKSLVGFMEKSNDFESDSRDISLFSKMPSLSRF